MNRLGWNGRHFGSVADVDQAWETYRRENPRYAGLNRGTSYDASVGLSQIEANYQRVRAWVMSQSELAEDYNATLNSLYLTRDPYSVGRAIFRLQETMALNPGGAPGASRAIIHFYNRHLDDLRRDRGAQAYAILAATVTAKVAAPDDVKELKVIGGGSSMYFFGRGNVGFEDAAVASFIGKGVWDEKTAAKLLNDVLARIPNEPERSRVLGKILANPVWLIDPDRLSEVIEVLGQAGIPKPAVDLLRTKTKEAWSDLSRREEKFDEAFKTVEWSGVPSFSKKLRRNLRALLRSCGVSEE